MNSNTFNGFLNIYKEAGWTSMDVCAKLRALLGVKRVGHAGTLDPMAEGVLPVAIGMATRDIDALTDSVKVYRTTMLLGKTTDTGDVSGKTVSEYAGTLPDEETIRTAIQSFVGGYEQLPPMYSARKVKGKRLYQYARAGLSIERQPKAVRIYDITIESIALPRVSFSVSCSRGTYVRALITDIGERLRTGACMEQLLRLRVGDFSLDTALKVSEVDELFKKGELDSALYVMAPSAVAIGKFDGTHLGHLAVLTELKNIAARRGLKTVVLVYRFDEQNLTSDEDMKLRMQRLGIDYCMELKFDDRVRHTPALTFLKDELIGRYHMKAIVAGEDVSFGSGKRGDAAFLRRYASGLGYELRIISRLSIREGEQDIGISSTLLKKRLREGRMESVKKLLGQNYCLRGEIVHGRHLGTEVLGIPTFNLAVDPELVLPPLGVYVAGFILYDPRTLREILRGKGIADLGYAPTFDTEEGGRSHSSLRLEVHALSEMGDCYGLMAEVALLKFLRPEERFDSAEELMKQIKESDIPAALGYFKEALDV